MNMKKEYPQCLNSTSILLPFKKKVIFVDWFGVLSKEVFWHNVDTSGKKGKKIQTLRDRLFNDHHLINQWMRGEITYIDAVESKFNDFPEVDKKFVYNKLLSYCTNITLNSDLFDFLRRQSNKCFIVLATDNMDCFLQSLEKLPQLGFFDSVLSSHFLKSLKRENPKQFFGKWLKYHRMSFEDSILIDDSQENCKAFQKCGGNYLNYSYLSSEPLQKDKILKWIES